MRVLKPCGHVRRCVLKLSADLRARGHVRERRPDHAPRSLNAGNDVTGRASVLLYQLLTTSGISASLFDRFACERDNHQNDYDNASHLISVAAAHFSSPSG